MLHNKINTVNHKEASRHEFDLLKLPKRQRVEARRCTIDNADTVCSIARNELPIEVASPEVVRSAVRYNKNNILIFCHKEEIVGFFAMLMLNHIGLERILLGEFDTLDPSPKCLAPRLETPMGIYIWAVVAHGIAAEGIKHASHFLNQPVYRHSNLFTRPTTDEGARIIKAVGFKPVDCGTEGLHRYVRLANRNPNFRQAA